MFRQLIISLFICCKDSKEGAKKRDKGEEEFQRVRVGGLGVAVTGDGGTRDDGKEVKTDLVDRLEKLYYFS